MNKFSTYKPELMGLLVAFLAIIAWYLSSLAIEHRIMPKTTDYIFNFLIVSFASFFGAFSAFLLNTKKDNEKEILEKVRALNSALFTAGRQINAISQLNRDILPFVDKNDGPFNLPPLKIHKNEQLRVDFSKLEFLVEEGGAELLQALSIEEERYMSAIEAVNLRTAFHYEVFQPALDKSELDKNAKVDEQTIRRELGDRVFFTAINMFEYLVEHVVQTHKSYPSVHKEIFDKAKHLFPGSTFIYIGE